VFVVDTSVTMAWCFEDEATDATEAVLDRLKDERAIAPALWSFEVANVLLVAEHRGRLTETQSSHFLALLEQLPIDVEDDAVDAAELVAVGRRHLLSGYDAAYLALAERRGAPLATCDERVAAAARTAGVQVL
jgi:predicted nucleic acid-binding protein